MSSLPDAMCQSQVTDGPKWLVERRLAALEALADAALPSEEDEAWRYSRIGELDLAAFTPLVRAEPSPSDPRAEALLESIGARSALVRTAAGRVVSVEIEDAAHGSGLRLGGAERFDAEPAGIGEAIAERPDAFVGLADAHALDVVGCELAPGAELHAPIVILHELHGLEERSASFPRTVVVLGAAARASVIEAFVGDDGEYLVVPVSEVVLGHDATLSYSTVQELGARTWSIAYQASVLGRNATLRSFVGAFGGDYARHLTASSLAGEGAASELLAVYFGDHDQVQDLRTFQEHRGARTRSDLLFKGAVAGRARSVYSGLIHMHPGAKRADASQTNRNLVLSEEAHADSVPNLNIEENDVRCSHASAVGPVDADQRFYLETRGVPSDVAERLILLGFFEDLLARAPEAGVAAHLRGLVADRLAASVLGGAVVGARS